MTKTYDDILREREVILGTFEALFKARGLGDLHGRVFGAILLSADAMTQDEISDFTGYSIPAVSSAIDDLVRLRLINKHKRQDSRKNYYSSRADLDEIMRLMLKTIHEDYVCVMLKALDASRYSAEEPNDQYVRDHIEIIQNYTKELKDLESYLKRLLEVPLEEKQ